MKVSVMENDKKRCLELAEQLPDVQIAYANGLKAEVLLQEGLKDADVCVSLTGSDENNLVIALFAWSCGTSSIITKVDSKAYESTKCLGTPFKSPKFKLKKNLLIGMIVRDGKAIVPGGNQMLLAGDRVIVITRRKQKLTMNTLNDIFD